MFDWRVKVTARLIGAIGLQSQCWWLTVSGDNPRDAAMTALEYAHTRWGDKCENFTVAAAYCKNG